MTVSKSNFKSNLPLPAYSFMVRIGKDTYGFSQVSGLNLEYETITYRHGLSVSEGANHLLGILQPIKITLQRGVARKESVLLEWISNAHRMFINKQDLTIDLCDEIGTPMVTWLIHNALPMSYETGVFDAQSNEVAVETIALLADSMRVTYHESNQRGGTRSTGNSFPGF